MVFHLLSRIVAWAMIWRLCLEGSRHGLGGRGGYDGLGGERCVTWQKKFENPAEVFTKLENW